jgi:16S rRNA (uracil1498-N3)-methyltransferase
MAVGARVELDDREAHHLRVRRVTDDTEVEVLDGAGFRGLGRLLRIGKRWVVEITQLAHQPRPAALTLAVATGDRDRFSWMVEKVVELGVTAIVPLGTARSAAVATGVKDRHVPALRRKVREVVKQSGAAWAPELEEPVSLETFLERPVTGVRWLADQAGEPPAPMLDQSSTSIVVGPEGGLTDGERSAVLAAGYRPVGLSRQTLRFETAAIAAAAAAVLARIRGAHG